MKKLANNALKNAAGGRLSGTVTLRGGLTPESQTVFKKSKPTDPTEGYPKPENPSM